MKKIVLLTAFIVLTQHAFCWGFYGHQKINYYSVFLLPPQMLAFYKQNIQFVSEHAVDPDKRRYAVAEEGPRHYIDIDRYGTYPFNALPRRWDSAVAKYGEDSLLANGIVPWWVQSMKVRLTNAFKEKDGARILKLSAEIGHYIADAHVPLHASSNHDGQHTDQKGIHGFWESRVPELLAEKAWDFFIGRAEYIKNTQDYIWKRVLESAAAADTVLKFEKVLSQKFPADQRYSFESRNGTVIRQYSSAYAKAYNDALGGMIERRMRQSIFSVASFWYTAWVDAGQPNLLQMTEQKSYQVDSTELQDLNKAWRLNA
ncbi:MAG: S1/P1 Nuclease, partial [Chitinophagaceae bacterium]